MALGAGDNRGGRERGGWGNDGERGNDSRRGKDCWGHVELGSDVERNPENKEGGDEAQESRNVPRIIFKRAARSCSAGDYSKRPATDADWDTMHFIEGRVSPDSWFSYCILIIIVSRRRRRKRL